MRTRTTLAATLFIVASAGCATLFNSDTKNVTMGSNPNEAEVWVDGFRRGVTPISLDLNNHESHTVVFRKEGYEDVACQLRASVGIQWIILDVLGGLIPVIIDAATGAWNGIEQGACNVVLPQSESESESPPADLLGMAQIAQEKGWVVFQRVEAAVQ